jgi:hypothetical protein
MESSMNFIPPVVQPWQEGLWWFLTTLIFLAWWGFYARTRADDFSFSERVLGAFISSIGQILATTFILGWSHQLSYWPLWTINAIFAVILFIGITIAPGGKNLDREAHHLLVTLWRLLAQPSVIWIIGISAVIAAAYGIYMGQLFPPMSWDSWGYHLGWAALAHQERYLGPFDIKSIWINFFPKNTDILFLWWIIGTGCDRWANIAQAPFAFASALSCYLLARRVGAGQRIAVVIGLLIFSIPTVDHMMWRAMVDLAAMGGFLSALAFLSRRKLNPASLALAGCAGGFIVGTKGSAMFYFIGLLLFLIYRTLPLGMDALRDKRGSRVKNIALFILIFGGVAFVFGSYFYLRNWVQTGNPTGLYEIKIGNVVLFEGDLNVAETHFNRRLMPDVLFDALEEGSEWPIVFDGFFDPQLPFFQGNRIGGWGAVWTALMLPAIPIAFLWALIRRRWSVIAIILACVIPYFLFRETHTWTRYHLPVIGAGTTALGYLLTVLRRTKYQRFLLIFASVFMVATVFISVPHHWLEKSNIEYARKYSYLHNDRYLYFNSWNDQDFANALQSVQEPGTTFAYTEALPRGKVIAVWNPTYSNRALWVPWENDGETWENDLIKSEAQAVYAGPDTDALEWAASHPGVFSNIYRGLNGGIYTLEFADESE